MSAEAADKQKQKQKNPVCLGVGGEKNLPSFVQLFSSSNSDSNWAIIIELRKREFTVAKIQLKLSPVWFLKQY